jgi:hypothetical protein
MRISEVIPICLSVLHAVHSKGPEPIESTGGYESERSGGIKIPGNYSADNHYDKNDMDDDPYEGMSHMNYVCHAHSHS